MIDLGFGAYSLYFHTFQIVSVITQELCSVLIIVLSEFEKRVLKAKIDFLINPSKFTYILHYVFIYNNNKWFSI